MKKNAGANAKETKTEGQDNRKINAAAASSLTTEHRAGC
jgi:hypothetical protein